MERSQKTWSEQKKLNVQMNNRIEITTKGVFPRFYIEKK